MGCSQIASPVPTEISTVIKTMIQMKRSSPGGKGRSQFGQMFASDEVNIPHFGHGFINGLRAN